MQDLHRRYLFEVLGWMASLDCICCNPTKKGKRKKRREYKRIINKQVRRRIKRNTRELLDKEYEVVYD